MGNETKPWWQSRGMIGSIIAVMAVVANYFDFEIPAVLQDELADTAMTLVAMGGGLLGLWGRLKATKAVTA